MTAQFRAFLVKLLSDPKKPRFVNDLAAELGMGAGAVGRYLRTLEQQQWVASCLELEAPGGLGRRRRRIYLLTDFGIRQARALLGEKTPADVGGGRARR